MKTLTKRQSQLLAFIRSHLRRHGYPPTLREMAGHLGVRSPNAVNDHLKALERKGYVRRKGGLKSRAITLTEKAIATSEEQGTVKVPLLGRVAAGVPLMAEQNVEDVLSMDRSLVGSGREELFALRVHGDSMTGKGIYDGDIVLVRSKSEARAGDIVVALIDGEATVKTYRPEKGRVVLEPANPAYEPIVVAPERGVDVSIVGIVIGLFRSFLGPVGQTTARSARL